MPATELGAAGQGHTGLCWRIATMAGLIVLILCAFLPAIMSGFVGWDDDDLLFNETTYRTLNSESLIWMFTTSYAGHFQPLTWLSYWLDWTIWKRAAHGYHLSSVLLHALTAVAFFFVARRLLAAAPSSHSPEDAPERVSKSGGAGATALTLAAGFAAALFAVHPLRAESVAWIAERRDVLAGFFFVTAVGAYLRRCQAGCARTSRAWYWAALGLQLVSLLAKAAAVTLPLVFLVLDYYPLGRRKRDPALRRSILLVAEKIPFLVLSLAGAARAWVAQVEAGAMYPIAEHDLVARVVQAGFGLAFYIAKTLVPLNLGPMYQLPGRELLIQQYLWKAVLSVALLASVAVWARRRWPALTAAIAAYVFIVLPVLGLFQSGPQLVADRYSYLSCLGFAILPAAALLVFARRTAGRANQRVPALCILAAAATVTALFHATAEQAKIWASPLALWAHAVRVSPSSSIAHTSFGDALFALNDMVGAAREYRLALELEPRDAIAAHHYGDALAALGDLAGAETMYIHSLRIDPHRGRVVTRLAQLLIRRDQPHQAAALLRERLRRVPGDLHAAAYLAELLATHPDPAVRDGCEASELAEFISKEYEHNNAAALLTWASAQAEEGRWDDALATAHRALLLADHHQLEGLSRELRYRMALFRQEEPYHFGD